MSIRESYLNGTVPEKLDIIDAHGHLGKTGTSSIYLRLEDISQNIELSCNIGIKRICASSFSSLRAEVTGGNREIFRIAEKYPDTIMGYAVYNPWFPGESIRDIDRYIRHEAFAGVKIHPRNHQCSLSSENYYPLWEYASENKCIVLCHTWKTEPLNDPALFFSILKKYGYLKILLGHSGGTYAGYETCYRLVREYPNVYMDLNGSLYSMKWIEQVAEETDVERLVFSTDQAFNDPRTALGRIVLSSLPDKAKIKILSENYKRMYGHDNYRKG